MSLLWTSDALVEAIEGRPISQMPEGITGISIDSRSLKPGDAFFAIKGDAMDGHDFATAAIKAGAALLVVSEGKLPALGHLGAPMIVVPDVLAALEKVGVAARARSRARIIAVTGSVGKTSTKEALRHALSSVSKVHASSASFNNHWGVPLTLARLPEDFDYAVFEIGMNHPGEISPLVRMVQPHIAVVTLIATAHIGFFRNLDEIAKAKAEIFEGVESGGAVLLNRDDGRFKLLEKFARYAGIDNVMSYGENARSTFRLLKCTLEADHSMIVVRIDGRDIPVRIGAPGRHIVQNALAVLGAAHLCGADVPTVATALAAMTAESGRGNRHVLQLPDGPITLIDESYNANPASMKAAIELLDATPVYGAGRRIAVLGDMFELGSYSTKLHSVLAELIGSSRTDMVMMAGPEMKALADTLPEGFRAEYRSGVEELKSVLFKTLQPGDAVMIKSSKGFGFNFLVDALIKTFPAHASNITPT